MMRKIHSRCLHSLFICAFLLLNFTNISAQTDWFFVALTTPGDVIFIDTNFTRSKSGITRVWQKTVSPDESYRIALGEWNCSEKKSRYVQSVMYNGNGIVIARSSRPSEWRYFTPDSTGMLLYSNICEDNQNTDPEERKNKDKNYSVAQVIVKKANLMSKANSNSKILRKVSLGEKLVLISEKPTGAWYRVLDPKTNSEVWLNGNKFKIVKIK